MLEIGSPVPDAQFLDSDGETLRLADYRGRAAVIVYFLRTTTCPVCNHHVRDLTARAATWPGVEVLLAVPEDRAAAAKWRAKRGLPFRVLIDSPHEAFGLGRGMLGTMQQSGTVLLDVGGVVRYTRSAALPTAAYAGKELAAAISEVQTAA